MYPSDVVPARRFGRAAFSISPWLVVDAALWVIAYLGALWVRFDFSAAATYEALRQPGPSVALGATVVLMACTGLLLGLYRGRFVPGSLLESAMLVAIAEAVTLVVFVAVLVTGPHGGLPRSRPVVAGAFVVLLALVLRSVVRRRELFGAGIREDAERVIVFGAGSGGRQLVQQLRRSSSSSFTPVAVLDDDPDKSHLYVDGVRVRGTRADIAEVAARSGATTLLVAIPSLGTDDLMDVRDRAEAAGLHVLVLPPLDAMMKGRVAEDELREIDVDDLLGRVPARLDLTRIAEGLRGRRVLVTGAGGSIGSELCRQLVRFRPGELMMLDRDESGLHATQLSIQEQAMLDGDDTLLVSIRDRGSVRRIFAERRPEIVFHAAALKHMPLLEHYPLEALKTNVLGTLNLLEAAEDFGVERFVTISTDKAANPSTALGTSKRISERLTAEFARRSVRTSFVSVRFGNVLGSRGSVLTVFEKQIRDGGPLTVTHPDVDRFFMTIPEACQLVLQAQAVGRTGETLVLDMGDPVRIADVARTLIERSGKEMEIVYTGLRAGEKLSEELFDDTEEVLRSGHEALSAVCVPPLGIDRDEIEAYSDHEVARAWLDRHAHDARGHERHRDDPHPHEVPAHAVTAARGAIL